MIEIFYCRDAMVHLNIKPKNILLDEAYNAKLTGFDFSRRLGQAAKLRSSFATERDAHRDPRYGLDLVSKDLDVFAIGVGM